MSNCYFASSCQHDCPPRVASGSRCKLYRDALERRAEERDRHGSVDVPRKLVSLGVPADAAYAAKAPDDSGALRAAKRFHVANRAETRELVLAGPRGVGKSVAAAWLLGQWVKAYDWQGQPSGGRYVPPFVWTPAADVVRVVDFGKVPKEWVEGLMDCRLLVLDDLGEDFTAVGVGTLADILKQRNDRRRATVITSNLPVDAAKDKPSLRSRYGDSWFERLRITAIVPDLSKEQSLRRRKP